MPLTRRCQSLESEVRDGSEVWQRGMSRVGGELLWDWHRKGAHCALNSCSQHCCCHSFLGCSEAGESWECSEPGRSSVCDRDVIRAEPTLKLTLGL